MRPGSFHNYLVHRPDRKLQQTLRPGYGHIHQAPLVLYGRFTSFYGLFAGEDAFIASGDNNNGKFKPF